MDELAVAYHKSSLQGLAVRTGVILFYLVSPPLAVLGFFPFIFLDEMDNRFVQMIEREFGLWAGVCVSFPVLLWRLTVNLFKLPRFILKGLRWYLFGARRA